MARGSIRTRTLKSKKKGKPEVRYIIRYETGLAWDERRQNYGRVQKQETVPAPHSRKHAEQLLAERLSQVNKGEFVEPSKMSFRDFKDKWLDTYARGHMKAGTVEDYQGYFKNHLLPAFGDRPVSKLTVEEVQAFKAVKLIEGYAPQTVKHLLRLLRQMLGHAVDWGYIRHNPAKKVTYPRVGRREMDCLKADEARMFLAAAPAPWHAFFLTAITTGLRVGELLAMRWGNMDWNSRRYFVRETLSRARYDYAGGFTSPKTEDSIQPVDITPDCLQALAEHKKRQAAERLKAGGDYADMDLIFATPKGTPLDHKNIVHRQFYSTLEAAGLRRLRFHDLRHTCASLLINQGVSPKSIQRQLRHASIDTTFDRYGHLFPETNAEVVEKLDAALRGDPVPEPERVHEMFTDGAQTG